MKKFLFLFLCCMTFIPAFANERPITSFPTSKNKETEEFAITAQILNYNRCNTVGIFLNAYCAPTFLWAIVANSVFTDRTLAKDPSAAGWGATAITSSLLCSGFLCSGLILLIYGAIQYRRYKKWGNQNQLLNSFSFQQKLFSHMGLYSGISAGTSAASFATGGIIMLFFPNLTSSIAFCSFVITSAACLTISLPMMIVCLALKHWTKKQCNRLEWDITQTPEQELKFSIRLQFKSYGDIS